MFTQLVNHLEGLSLPRDRVDRVTQTQSFYPFFSGTRNLGVFYLCTSFIVFGAPDGNGGGFVSRSAEVYVVVPLIRNTSSRCF